MLDHCGLNVQTKGFPARANCYSQSPGKITCPCSDISNYVTRIQVETFYYFLWFLPFVPFRVLKFFDPQFDIIKAMMRRMNFLCLLAKTIYYWKYQNDKN